MGEKTLDQVDGEAKVEAATRSAMAAQPLMDGQGRRFQNCHADGCDQAPFDESGCRSAPLTVSGGVPPIASWPVPDDHLPPEPTHRYDLATMRFVPTGAELERLERKEEERKEKVRER
jgi:hypothetical protein